MRARVEKYTFVVFLPVLFRYTGSFMTSFRPSVFMSRRLLSLLALITASAAYALPVQATRGPGAARALRLTYPPLANLSLSDNAPALHGAWLVDEQTRETSLIFTREIGGTCNLWQATPDPNEAGVWQIAPLTTLSPPLWIDEPVATPDGRAILCVTNAVGDRQMPQIARLDWKTRKLIALTSETTPPGSPALSPNGKSLAFVRTLAGQDTIFVLSLPGSASGAPITSAPRRVVEGRHPAWLNNDTLLFSGIKAGLFRLTIPTDWPPLRPLKARPQFLYRRGGDVAVSPDGSQLCLAPDDIKTSEKTSERLYFIAANGSGERALNGTEGAHAPRFSPDGGALLYDAPGNRDGTNAEAQRTLWMMNLTSIAPTVQLTRAVTVATQGVSTAVTPVKIIGTVFSPDAPNLEVKLEVGEGTEPRKWMTIATPRPPLQGETLGLWTPPANAKGEWALRLSAKSPGGTSEQTTLTITFPLPVETPGSNNADLSANVSISVAPMGGISGLTGLHGINSRTVIKTPDIWPDKNPTSVPRPGFNASGSNTPGNGPVPTTVPATTPTATIAPSPNSIAPRPPVPTFAAKTYAPPATPTAQDSPPTLPSPVRSSSQQSGSGALPNLPLPALPPPPSLKKNVPPTPPIAPGVAPRGSNTSSLPPVTPPTPPAMTSKPPVTPSLGGPQLTPQKTTPAVTLPPRVPPSSPIIEPLPAPNDNTPVEIFSGAPVRTQKAPPPQDKPPVKAPDAPPRETPSNSSAPTKTLAPRATATDISRVEKSGNARLSIEAPPARVGVGESLAISGTARNTGRAPLAPTGTNPLRLLVRWFDEATGRRAYWQLIWPPAAIAPGQSVELSGKITPPRAGRFRLVFSLVRLPGGKYQPPSTLQDDSGADVLDQRAFLVIVE